MAAELTKSELTELTESFREAVEHFGTCKELPEDVRKKLFGLFHRARENTPDFLMQRAQVRQRMILAEDLQDDAQIMKVAEEVQQSMLVARAQVTELEKVEHLSPIEAKRQYIQLLSSADPSFLWKEDAVGGLGGHHFPTLAHTAETMPGFASKSTMAPDAAKMFGAVRDGDVGALAPLLSGIATIVDDDGLSPLHHAVDAEQVETSKALLDARADPNALDASLSTPLHYAALLGSLELVNMLLEAGAKPLQQDEDGKTPLDLAKAEGHEAALLAALAPSKTEAKRPSPRPPPATAGPSGAASSSSSSSACSSSTTIPPVAPIPLIDVGAFVGGAPEVRAAIARDFDRAFCTVGVCQLTNYGNVLPEDVISKMREASSAFFSGSTVEKRKAHVDGVVGYLGLGAENVGASAGAPTAQPDPVESLNLPGYQDEGSTWRADRAAAECPWRDAAWLPRTAGFDGAAVRYWDHATRLMTLLMEMTELALELPTGFFTGDGAAYARPGTLLRVAWYPPSDEANVTDVTDASSAASSASRLRYGAHTDYDGFTILQRAPTPAGKVDGLEFEARDGSWLAVPSPADTLTINIGDLLAKWTNDRWRATRHRVAMGDDAGSSTTGRLSIVYFTGPHPDTLVECVPSAKCKPPGEAPKHEPITAAAHVEAKMLAATQAAREAGASGSGSVVWMDGEAVVLD